MQRLVPPFRGVANSTGFIDTPAGFAPYALDADGLPITRNCIPHTPASKDRGAIGQRAGHSLVFPQQCGGGLPWQALISVRRSSVVTGYTQASCDQATSGSSLESGALTSVNYIQLDSVPSSDGVGFLDDGVSHANSVNAAAACQRLQSGGYYLCFVSTNYTGTDGLLKAQIRCFRDDTGETVWTYTISDATLDQFINTMTCSDHFLFVCTNAVVVMLRVTDGSLVTTNTLGGFAQEAIEGGVYKDASGDEWYFVAFNGTEQAGRTQDTNGADIHMIEAGVPASMFRTGVQRYRINNEYVSDVGPYSSAAMTSEALGWGQTATVVNGVAVPDNAGTDYNEGFHGYFRISERSAVTGHGCLVTALAVDPRNGSVAITRTNQGYGPNSTGTDRTSGQPFTPDGAIFPSISVMKISFAGRLLGEWDPGSITNEIGVGGVYNDIPTGPGDDPSFSVCRINRLGVLCVGGRTNDVGLSVFGLDADIGTILWEGAVQDTGSLRQACAAVDPGDQHFWVGGDRNSAWDGSGGNDAHLWKMNPSTGEIVRTWDVGSNVSALGIGMMGDGSMVVGMDFIA